MYRIILFLLICAPLYAAPFRCVDGTIYSDKNICSQICSESCEEMDSFDSGDVCDETKYRGFFSFDKKTYALTKYKTFWESENTVQIDDDGLNSILAGILKYYGENEAWIGAHDPKYTNNYNTVNPERFIWKSGDYIVWSSWAAGQPDNRMTPDDISKTSIYGEYWVYMNNRGEWFDAGGRGAAIDNYHEKKYSFVEFAKPLKCTSGTLKDDSGLNEIINSVCGEEEDCMSCIKLKDDNNVDIKKCHSGRVFDPATGRPGDNTKLICPLDMTACDVKTICPADSRQRGNMCCRKRPHLFSFRYECRPVQYEATCPSGGDCVDVRGKFYCSGTGCAEIESQYIQEKDDYKGDQVDNGKKDQAGNCLGNLYLFSGMKKDCRRPSVRRPGINCCQSNGAWKPRFQCEGKGTLYDDAGHCNKICGKTCDLLKKAPPDLKLDILGFSLNVCNAAEKELAFRRSMFPNGGNCKYIGRRCVERWSIGKICAQHKDVYCCYESPLAKIIQEAAHSQLNLSWGSPSSPNCGGLTPDQFQMLNLDNIDYSAWIEGYVTPALSGSAAEMLKGMVNEK